MTKNKDIYNVTFTGFDKQTIPSYLKDKIKFYSTPTVTQEELNKNYTKDIHTGEYMKKSINDASYSGDPIYEDTFIKALENSRKKYEKQFQPDSIVQKIQQEMNDRAKMGFEKYNATLDRTDLSVVDYLQHAKEEALDLALYLEKTIQMLKGNG
jgi:hypothetical protein